MQTMLLLLLSPLKSYQPNRLNTNLNNQTAPHSAICPLHPPLVHLVLYMSTMTTYMPHDGGKFPSPILIQITITHMRPALDRDREQRRARISPVKREVLERKWRFYQENEYYPPSGGAHTFLLLHLPLLHRLLTSQEQDRSHISLSVPYQIPKQIQKPPPPKTAPQAPISTTISGWTIWLR